MCSLCPEGVLDPHALTCKRGGDVVTCHNKLRDTLAEACRRAHLNVKVEAGANLTHDHSHSHPADILVPNWSVGKPAAFDLFLMLPLNSKLLLEAGQTAGVAARAIEQWKHKASDTKCKELGGFVSPWLWRHMVLGGWKLVSHCHVCLSPSPFCPDIALDSLGHHEWLAGMGEMWPSATIICTMWLQTFAVMLILVYAWRWAMVLQEMTTILDLLNANCRVGQRQACCTRHHGTSPLTPVIFGESCQMAGAAALAAETRKHCSNGPKCQELGWTCVPLAVETFGNWGNEAQDVFTRLASHLAVCLSVPKADIYGRMNITLVRCIARTILVRDVMPSRLSVLVYVRVYKCM